MSRARHWVFTKNNYTDSTIAQLRDLWNPEDSENILKYLIFQYELAPETGTPHLQGYIALERAIRFNQVRNLLPNGAHIEMAQGTPQQCKDYCSKEESRDPAHSTLPFEEFGNLPPRRGARTDVDGVVEMVRSGKRIRDVAESAGSVFIKYQSGIKALRAELQPRIRPCMPELTYIWGWPGEGKTYYANVVLTEKYGEDEVYFKPAGQWWPLYDGQKAVVMDDFTSADIALREWNKVFNHITHFCQYKGGFVPVTFLEAYITSNFPPQMLWPGVSRARRASAIRRISTCIFVYKPDANSPTNFLSHDPFTIPQVATRYIQELAGPQEGPNYLEQGARNHALQRIE